MLPRRKQPLILMILCLWITGCQAAPVLTPTATPSPFPKEVETATPTIVWFPPTATPKSTSTPVVSPTPDLKPGLGEIILTDSFEDQSGWDVLRSEKGSVLYGNEELTITVTQPKATLATFRKADTLTNFYLEISANPSLCLNGDSYGVLFRVSSPLDYYRLLINCSGQLRLEAVRNGVATVYQNWQASSQVPPGSPLEIRLGLWVSGNEKKVFVNDQFQFSVSDPVWKAGWLGLFARSMGETALTVNFLDLSVRLVENVPTATPMPGGSATAQP